MTEQAGREKIAGSRNRNRLRKAINIDNKTDLIRTVRSMGYSLEPSAE